MNIEFFLKEEHNQIVEEIVMSYLKLLQNFGEITINEGVINSKFLTKGKVRQFSYISTFGKMCGYLVDAYQMVVMAVQEICVADLVVREIDLVNELHKAILNMFDENLVRELMSCLHVVISCALSSCYKMGLIQSKSFPSPDGGKSRFILANRQQRL